LPGRRSCARLSIRMHKAAVSDWGQHGWKRNLKIQNARLQIALRKGHGMMRTKRNVIERAAILAQSDFSIGASIQIVEHRARQTVIRNRSKISDADNPGRSNGS